VPTQRPVLLVGSVPLGSATEVFETIASSLGGLARRIPDGETGNRLDFIGWQQEVFRKAAGLEAEGRREVPGGPPFTTFRLKAGVAAKDVKFGPTGYAAAALQSFEDFKRLRAVGKVPAGMRLQVCLPTPLAVTNVFVAEAAALSVWPTYERRLLEEVDEVCRAIPHRDLAIQWDLVEPVIMEGSWARLSVERVASAIARLVDRVPADVEVGMHLCYGDRGHKHLVEPKDMALMIDLSNRVSSASIRSITWLHMPVPRSRSDDAYFAPLRDLNLKTLSELYLGIVHLTDGIDGAKRRLAAAKRAAADFGIATECGWGRRQRETVPALLNLHREIAQLGQAGER